MDENKIREIEARKLTEGESEKVAGGIPQFGRRRRRKPDLKKDQGIGQSDGVKADDGSVSGSGSW